MFRSLIKLTSKDKQLENIFVPFEIAFHVFICTRYFRKRKGATVVVIVW